MLSAFSSKANISYGMGCISAYDMGSLHVLEGTMNAERYIKGFRATYAPLQKTSISEVQCKITYFSDYNSIAS